MPGSSRTAKLESTFQRSIKAKIMSRITDLIKKRWAYLVIAASIVAALFAFGDSAVNIFSFFDEKRKNIFGANNENLVVIKSRLVPWDPGTTYANQKEQFFLHIYLRNYGNNPVIITSADIGIIDSNANVTVGIAGSSGVCYLSSDPNENHPIRLDPGQGKWIGISPAIRLIGLSNWLFKIKAKDIGVISDDQPVSIHELKYIDEINREMAALFGSEARITLTLYTEVGKRVGEFSFMLTKGKDIFTRDGSLMHDFLIAAWINWNPRVLSLGRDCTEDT